MAKRSMGLNLTPHGPETYKTLVPPEVIRAGSEASDRARSANTTDVPVYSGLCHFTGGVFLHALSFDC